MDIDQLIEPVLALPRAVKRAIAIAVDAGLCLITVWWAFYLRLGEWVPLSREGWPAAMASLVIALPIFIISGLYRPVFRHASFETLASIAQAVLIYGIIYSSIFTSFGVPGVPRTVGLIQPVLLLIAVASSRAFGRYWLGGRYRDRLRRRNRRNVLIYGAGAAGRQLAAALADSYEMRVVGFIDDDSGLRGSVVGRIRTWGPEKLAEAVDQLNVAEVFLAIPSASRTRRNQILELIRSAGVAVRTLPGLLDLAHGRVTVSQLKPLDIEDLLAREAVAPDQALLARNVRGKVVLVTGAGGSIGSELCRQILAQSPARLLLLESSEYALYAIHRELSRKNEAAPELLPLLGSVCDPDRLRRIFAAWRPDTVYHAAAYKHVPLVEHNPIEGIRNNVFGTWETALTARDFGVSSFVLVSTDKAVRPTNMMGATKRLAEMALQALAAEGPQTCFSMVRFGNVLGSSGSVVPLFRQQIANGGPVTVTHREITRYFMTITEASQLVIQASSMATGGDVFVLDMGDPVRVADLARRMIELSGLEARDDQNPDGDLEIAFTGLRPGEKLYEELLIGNDPAATEHPRVMRAHENFLPLARLQPRLSQLEKGLAEQDLRRVRAIVSELVSDYVPAAEVVDLVHLQERVREQELRSALAGTSTR